MASRLFFTIGTLFKIAGVVFFTAAFSFFAAPANAGFQAAGFQWVAPADQAPQQAYSATPNSPGSRYGEMPPPMMPAPEIPVMRAPSSGASSMAMPPNNQNPEIISPIVIEGPPLLPSPSSAPRPEQSSSLGTLPVPSAPDVIVQGFANNVPLAVALREILPPGYGFSIDQDVDLGTLVSFQGGKPWRDTLQSTLAAVGLGMREQNEMVAIGRTAPSAAAMSAAPNEIVAGSAPLPAPQPWMAAPGAPPPGSVRSNGMVEGPKPSWTQPAVRLPAPPPAPPPVSSSRLSSASVVDTWTATRGETLHKTFENWSHRAGAEFEWAAEYDYPLQASVSFTGTFEEAVRSLLSGFEDAHPQPVAELHANPGAGQMVLVIQTRGNSNTD